MLGFSLSFKYLTNVYARPANVTDARPARLGKTDSEN